VHFCCSLTLQILQAPAKNNGHPHPPVLPYFFYLHSESFLLLPTDKASTISIQKTPNTGIPKKKFLFIWANFSSSTHGCHALFDIWNIQVIASMRRNPAYLDNSVWQKHSKGVQESANIVWLHSHSRTSFTSVSTELLLHTQRPKLQYQQFFISINRRDNTHPKKDQQTTLLTRHI
jgi:hypothetical protein